MDIHFFLYGILAGYPFTVVIILFGGWLTKNRKTLFEKLLGISNILLACASLTSSCLLLLNEHFQFNSEAQSFYSRAIGTYWFAYLMAPILPGLIPQLFWFPRLRRCKLLSIIAAASISLIPALERLVIFLTSLQRDYIPSSWIYYPGTAFEIASGIIVCTTAYLALVGAIYFVGRKLNFKH